VTASRRLLIVNADDFGLNDAANAGIVQSYQAGSVTSTTLMANAPATIRATELAHQHPGLGVGLHFNLTWGKPLSSPDCVPSLIGVDGGFLDRRVLSRRLVTGRVPIRQVALELEAQFARLLELGISPTHVDSHQHVHGFEPVFDAVASHCVEAGIPMRVPWVMSTRGGFSRRMRRLVLAGLLAHATRRWRDRVRWNDDLGSVFDDGVESGVLGDADYLRILARARGSAFELMVHPVSDAASMAGYTRIGAVAEAEFHYLRAGTLAALARSLGLPLGTYRDLAV
jgi:predicted glycoside hydrolase/deacetylase ChbG (UPF0249 family)